MALRYVARRVGVPSLRRASGAHASASAGSEPLASRSSQAGYSNGDASWKMNKRLRQSLAEKNGAVKEIDEVAEIKASYKAVREAIEHARRMKNGDAGTVL